MEKFPFTTQGAAQLMDALYALPQGQLELEASAAGSDFSAWIVTHFELDPAQLAYLAAVDPQWLQHAGTQTCTFLQLGLPILLQKAEAPAVAGDRGKLLDLEKQQNLSYSQTGGLNESQVLIFKISYGL